MYPTNDSRQATTRYADTFNQTMNTYDSIMALLRILITNLEQARQLYAEGRFERMFEYNKKSFHIFLMLRSTAKVGEEENDTEILRQVAALRNFYHSLYIRLVNIASHKQALAEFDEITALVKQVYENWKEVGATESNHSSLSTPAQHSVIIAS
jgi:flagellin-specific chaperone FliS